MTKTELEAKIAQVEGWLATAKSKAAAADKVARSSQGRARRAAFGEVAEQTWRAKSFQQQLNVLCATRPTDA